MASSSTLQKLHDQLRAHALGYPDSDEHFPWGHTTIKVRGKSFLFMSLEGGQLSLSTKLPESREAALLLPFAEPTGYGLGKSGWVTARFVAADAPPLEMLQAWVDESFRAIAPKTLVARAPAAAAPAKQPAAKKTAAKKTAAKKTAAKKTASVKKAAAKKTTAKSASKVRSARARRAG